MPKPPKPSPRTDVGTRLKLLAAARVLYGGGLLAHTTATMPGIAAHPASSEARCRLQRFKRRNGPFLLLAASRRAAARWARYFTPELRLAMRRHWPGNTTLVFAARPGLPAVCYSRGNIAVRVDANPSCRRLARLAGGLLISSSLNRRGRPVVAPSHRLRWRWQRYLAASLAAEPCTHHPSSLLLIRGSRSKRLR